MTRIGSTFVLLGGLTLSSMGAEFYVSPQGSHEPPFATWATAATNIQDAIDAAAASDTVWVTNGVYGEGGRTAGDALTNRVVLSKALTVQSVNGPEFTTIVGAWDVNTNGPAAVRCAWLTTGATLNGFTLYRGATLQTSPGNSGGGVCGYSKSAKVVNCVVATNCASIRGGGAYNVTIENSTLVGNEAVPTSPNYGSGGGAAYCDLRNCRVLGNRSSVDGGGISDSVARSCAIVGNVVGEGSAWPVTGGGGAFRSVLLNSTVAGNSTAVYTYQPAGAAVKDSTLTNCIVYGNGLARGSYSGTNLNYQSSTFSYCCTTPLPPGEGNIEVDPLLLDDRFHLSTESPCRGAGKVLSPGTDADGQPWLATPSIGCDEWYADPLFEGRITLDALGSPPTVMLKAPVAVGKTSTWMGWNKNGKAIEADPRWSGENDRTLIITNFGVADAGQYQVFASNSVGVVASMVLTLTVRCVDASSSSSVPPYTSWETAANNIQDAIDAASVGDVVLVTNGMYASGGRLIEGQTNRIAMDKALVVSSMQGAAHTFIQGAWDPVRTNGQAAVRCAWLGNGAVLNGFTLFRGATYLVGYGGGVWGAATNAMVRNCVITTNSSPLGGGGAFRVSLLDCALVGNRVPQHSTGSIYVYGGGAYACGLRNCRLSANQIAGMGAAVSDSLVENTAVTGNFSERWAGGVYRSVLRNCTVAGNRTGTDKVAYAGGAVRDCSLTNCIAYANTGFFVSETNVNFTTSSLTYSCSNPLPLGEGNINSDPRLLSDSIHLAETSPCRGAGTNLSVGTDIDGQVWQNRPSIGCDEWEPVPVFIGRIRTEPFNRPVSLRLVGPPLAGQGPWGYAWTRDGQTLEEGGKYSSVPSDTLSVISFSPEDSGRYELTASNQFGIAKALVDLTVRCVSAENPTPLAPYVTWSTAATNIQDAIDIATATDVVLVTNGLYLSGGRIAVAGDITNRVVVDKPIVVTSANGYQDTVIEGAWDPNTTNGPLAVRGAYLANGSTLNGFTIRRGASGGTFPLDWRSVDGVIGGGVWGQSTNAFLFDCRLYGNSAKFSGGGCANLSVRNCILQSNHSYVGAGSYGSLLTNCLVIRNNGGGVYRGTLFSSTVVGNFGGGYGADSLLEARNSIIYSNFQSGINGPGDLLQTATRAPISYSCVGKTIGLPLIGESNIVADPQILRDYQLAVTSPCRGAGSAAFASGTDLDGQPWANPPSIGCSEVWESERVGPLTVDLTSSMPEVTQGGSLTLQGSLTGSATRVGWDFGDGNTLTNQSLMSLVHTWTNPGDYEVTFTAYNTEQVDGVSTNLVVHVIPLETPSVSLPELMGTNFGLTFPTQPGVTYAIQRATNLEPPIVWQTLTSVYSTGKYDFRYTDTKATNDTSFYRLLIP